MLQCTLSWRIEIINKISRSTFLFLIQGRKMTIILDLNDFIIMLKDPQIPK